VVHPVRLHLPPPHRDAFVSCAVSAWRCPYPLCSAGSDHSDEDEGGSVDTAQRSLDRVDVGDTSRQGNSCQGWPVSNHGRPFTLVITCRRPFVGHRHGRTLQRAELPCAKVGD
jgi:hypothetical protein